MFVPNTGLKQLITRLMSRTVPSKTSVHHCQIRRQQRTLAQAFCSPATGDTFLMISRIITAPLGRPRISWMSALCRALTFDVARTRVNQRRTPSKMNVHNVLRDCDAKHDLAFFTSISDDGLVHWTRLLIENYTEG